MHETDTVPQGSEVAKVHERSIQRLREAVYRDAKRISEATDALTRSSLPPSEVKRATAVLRKTEEALKKEAGRFSDGKHPEREILAFAALLEKSAEAILESGKHLKSGAIPSDLGAHLQRLQQLRLSFLGTARFLGSPAKEKAGESDDDSNHFAMARAHPGMPKSSKKKRGGALSAFISVAMGVGLYAGMTKGGDLVAPLWEKLTARKAKEEVQSAPALPPKLAPARHRDFSPPAPVAAPAGAALAQPEPRVLPVPPQQAVAPKSAAQEPKAPAVLQLFEESGGTALGVRKSLDQKLLALQSELPVMEGHKPHATFLDLNRSSDASALRNTLFHHTRALKEGMRYALAQKPMALASAEAVMGLSLDGRSLGERFSGLAPLWVQPLPGEAFMVFKWPLSQDLCIALNRRLSGVADSQGLRQGSDLFTAASAPAHCYQFKGQRFLIVHQMRTSAANERAVASLDSVLRAPNAAPRPSPTGEVAPPPTPGWK